jgi:protease IV
MRRSPTVSRAAGACRATRCSRSPRVWTGQQAKAIGLVDELGGFTRALAVAKEAIGVAPDRAVELRAFPPPLDLWDQALELLGDPPGLIDAVGVWLQWLRPGMLSAPPIVVR